MPDLSVENLHVFRGDRHLLKGLSLVVSSGCCLQVTGANGSGKTSLLRALAGLLQAESIEIHWQGRQVGVRDSDYLHSLAYLGHEAPLKADLSGRENIRFAVGIRRPVSDRQLQAAFQRVDAAGFADRPVRSLSAGQRRRIALAGGVPTGRFASHGRRGRWDGGGFGRGGFGGGGIGGGGFGGLGGGFGGGGASGRW